jgi:hypothetical protein
MQQRQLRLGDILDDYCPRERRLTNHAVVAMVGDTVKQTRCTTCDAEHEYKHAKVPRQRRKSETPAALYAQVAAGGPKRVAHEAPPAPHDADQVDANAAIDDGLDEAPDANGEAAMPVQEPLAAAGADAVDESDPDATGDDTDADEPDDSRDEQDGPIHRRLIRASLPRQEGQQPPARPIPEFTIRQPAGRQNRFRPRHQRGGAGPGGAGGAGGGGQQFNGNRSNGNVHGGPPRGMRPGGGRPPQGAMAGRRHNQGGRKRSK